ncbi:Uncharacterized protein APZ42_016196 [Daphnia magna]|uniref:Uncharacterized protein n=1 Tax=Daphnia magna TaxID=35525 RepID=A0A165AJJ4_9CRUS|nr:Uncharacterized protein APZ42_016196 [Daphnia magna]
MVRILKTLGTSIPTEVSLLKEEIAVTMLPLKKLLIAEEYCQMAFFVVNLIA